MAARGEPINGVQPELLKWARESATSPADDVAERFNKRAAETQAWENGQGGPTYAQLERLAYEIYKTASRHIFSALTA